MQDKTEQTQQPSYLGWTSSDIHQWAWQSGNFTAKTLATTALITLVQSPVKTALVNFTKYNTFAPTDSTLTGGFLSFVKNFKSFYVGTSTTFSGSTVRTMYVTNTRNNKPIEETFAREESLVEESSTPKNKVHPVFIGFSALGEGLVTNSFETRSLLAKSGVTLPSKFSSYTPYNFYKLTANGFGLKLITSWNSFACMLLLEDQIANQLPIQNEAKKHAIAGAISGITASLISHPFTTLKEHIAAQTKITENGTIINRSSLSMTKELMQQNKDAMAKAIGFFLTNTKKQAFVRAGLAGTIFSIIAGSDKIFGHEPLAKIVPEEYRPSTTPQSFFAGTKKTSVDTASSPAENNAPPPQANTKI